MGSYTTKRKLYKPSIGETGWGSKVNQNWDILDDHKHVRDDITDLLPIKRSDLEYPTENVNTIYLLAIGKMYFASFWGLTLDNFTDKAIELIHTTQGAGTGLIQGRFVDYGNRYFVWVDITRATDDVLLEKRIAGTDTVIASEAVDLPIFKVYSFKLSLSGSTLKVFRDPDTGLTETNSIATTLRISATDTDLSSGKIGYQWSGIYIDATAVWRAAIGYIVAILRPPSSALYKPSAIVEYDVIQKQYTDMFGKTVNFNAPDMPQDLVEVSKDMVTPEEWEALQSNCKGVNGLPLVDRNSVAWGAIDYKGEPTMLCAIYGGSLSYLHKDRILRRIEHARRKGRKVFKVPKNVSEAKELHRIIKRDRPKILITENELAYQLLGLPELEIDAIADFYERELINLNRIKGVPTWELHRTLDRWENLAKKHNRLEALNKIRRCKKK